MTTVICLTENDIRSLHSSMIRAPRCEKRDMVLSKLGRDHINLSNSQVRFILLTDPSYQSVFETNFRFESSSKDDWQIYVL